MKENTIPNQQSGSAPSPPLQINIDPDDIPQEIKREPPEPFMPTELIIPAVKVKAKVEPVGVLPNGQMDVPKHTNLVGLLHPGVIAGERGNMVMDGHVDSYTGPAVFFNLKKLKTGDQIVVRNQKRRQLTYIVQSVEAYRTAEAPVDKVFGETDVPMLNLVTCTGKYSRKKKEHEQRLIVFAKLDGEL
ncbi:class F sortase [Paenibacillus fonticola]|uniref:class F sortase n=1 Tax=Paenibacillus fonticola TaxID=379896 RepID=UPI00146A3B94|nr:class F sortase [Paenibacillus fonticola]